MAMVPIMGTFAFFLAFMNFYILVRSALYIRYLCSFFLLVCHLSCGFVYGAIFSHAKAFSFYENLLFSFVAFRLQVVLETFSHTQIKKEFTYIFILLASFLFFFTFDLIFYPFEIYSGLW